MNKLDRLRQDVAELRSRTADDEEALERAEELLLEEERKVARARRLRLTRLELAHLDTSIDRSLVDRAVDELRDHVLSMHDRAVLEAIGARLDGYERDLIERLLEMTGPRSEP